MFHIADPKDIKNGKMTDIYFVRTMQVLKAKKIDKWVKAEFIAKRFPEDYGWGVLAGIEEVAYLLKDLKVSVRAMKEGTIFRAFEPVMEIEGMYTDFGLYETSSPGSPLPGIRCSDEGRPLQKGGWGAKSDQFRCEADPSSDCTDGRTKCLHWWL